MRKVRKVVILVMAIWMTICLAGCEREVEEDSEQWAQIWCNEGCISIYSPISSTIFVEATVEYSEQEITVVEQFFVYQDENKIINAEDLNEELFDENSKIIYAEIIKQTYNDYMEFHIFIAFIVVAVVLGIFLAVISENPEEQEQ